MSQEQCVLDTTPRQAIVADRVCDKIVIGKDEMKEMVEAIVVEDIDIPNRLP